jgi:PAS domain S-box-containing protein
MDGDQTPTIAPIRPARPEDFGIGRLFWAIQDAVIVGDAASGRIVLWNPAAERLFGFSVAEAIGLPMEVLVPESLKARHRAGLARFAATGHGPLVDRGLPVELPALYRDGSARFIELSLTPIADAAGPGRYVLAIVRDATERKRAERDAQDLASAREASERLAFLAEAGAVLASSLDYATTLDNLAHLAVPRLADWCIVDVVDDDGALRRVAVAHANPGKADLADVLRRNPPDLAKDTGIGRVLRTGQADLVPDVPPGFATAVARSAAHLAALRAIGQRSWMGVALRARGRILGALSLSAAESGRRFDANDLALAEELAGRAAIAVDNARLYQEAQEAVAARDRFLSVATHELRTPLTTIKGMADLLDRQAARGPLDPERVQRYARRIGEATGRLTTLTEDLLDLSRLRSGRLPLRLGPVDLTALASAKVERYRDRADPIHAWTLDAAPQPCAIEGDRDRLVQVLVNLLDNAVKYAPAGGTIRVAVRPEGAGVRLEVSDEGIGLPPGEADRIFEPFERAANAEASGLPGLGLGLSICRGIVEQHGGWIAAESAGEGHGTTVTVWLPCNQPHPD